MNTRQKLQLIQKYSSKTQEELARDLNVSFPTLNSWINGKSQPRSRAVEKIDSMYIEYLGDTSIGEATLKKKNVKLQQLQQQFSNPFSILISRKDIYIYPILTPSKYPSPTPNKEKISTFKRIKLTTSS